MKNKIIMLLTILLFSCSVTQKVTSNNDIFLVIKNSSKKNKCGAYPDLFYQNKNKLTTKIDFFDFQKDTIYFIQEYNIQTGELKESFWNKIDKVEYRSHMRKIELSDIKIFDDEVYSIVNTWNIKTINNVSNSFGANTKTAFKVILENNKAKVECVSW